MPKDFYQSRRRRKAGEAEARRIDRDEPDDLDRQADEILSRSIEVQPSDSGASQEERCQKLAEYREKWYDNLDPSEMIKSREQLDNEAEERESLDRQFNATLNRESER